MKTSSVKTPEVKETRKKQTRIENTNWDSRCNTITHFVCPPSTREVVKAQNTRPRDGRENVSRRRVATFPSSSRRCHDASRRLHFYPLGTNRPRNVSGDLEIHSKSCFKNTIASQHIACGNKEVCVMTDSIHVLIFQITPSSCQTHFAQGRH